ncbi:hypothetical protein GWK47_052384 [Chionoecetes opilio]|uniref:Uncharacterized protein n=1 Tax=Chionoecetes opilio TaxID=41210 RepID=A0A8J4Y8Z7_CHIOP|nr:hypothetical protein GWK47_052384 [Chionoecetes opilio]
MECRREKGLAFNLKTYEDVFDVDFEETTRQVARLGNTSGVTGGFYFSCPAVEAQEHTWLRAMMASLCGTAKRTPTEHPLNTPHSEAMDAVYTPSGSEYTMMTKHTRHQHQTSLRGNRLGIPKYTSTAPARAVDNVYRYGKTPSLPTGRVPPRCWHQTPTPVVPHNTNGLMAPATQGPPWIPGSAKTPETPMIL